MTLVIRHATPDDQDALVELFLGLNVYENAITGDRRTDHAGAVASLAAASKRVNDTGGAALVTVLNGCVVGHLFRTFEQDAVFMREEPRGYAHVAELFVADGKRDAGVGKALMQQAEDLAAARGSRRLMVGVLVGNTRAEALYVRLGFLPSSVELKKRIGAGAIQRALA